MTESQLNTVIKILGVDQNSASDVEIINLLFAMVDDAICLRVGVETVPEKLQWIANEIVIKRFQLIGAEHLESEGIDVLSSTYRNPSTILDEYSAYFANYIALYIDNEQTTTKVNKCRLL